LEERDIVRQRTTRAACGLRRAEALSHFGVIPRRARCSVWISSVLQEVGSVATACWRRAGWGTQPQCEILSRSGVVVKIDIFNHVFPKAFFDRYIRGGGGGKDIGKRVLSIPVAVDLEHRFRVMDEFGDFRQVITLPTPPIEVFASPDVSRDVARAANDGLAELVAKHPDRFIAFAASLPLNDFDGCLREAERAIDELGARGVMLFSNARGVALDTPALEPLFAEMARRDLPIWLHPIRDASFADYQTERESQYEIWWTFGWPYDTSVAMARLVFAGIFDRYPGIKIITHHMGGMIPYFEGRVGHGWDQLGKRTSDRDYTALLRSMKRRPVDYFHDFYADTALFGATAATRCGLEFFGADHVVFATDMPFDPSPGLYARETIRILDGLDITADARDRIYRRNALRLLKMDTASHSPA
jgi:predicted TIM-barrel fold metal-dependent hydrolase